MMQIDTPFSRHIPRHLACSLALSAGLLHASAAAPELLTNAVAAGFPDFLSTINASSKGWNFAPSDAGLRWVELNKVLLQGNGGTNDPQTGIAFKTKAMPYLINGFEWNGLTQIPARNGISRGGIHGNKEAMHINLPATPGHTYVLEVLTLATAPKRSMAVTVDNQSVLENWIVPADPGRNALLRIRLTADADGIDLRLAPGTAAGADTNPAVTALALTDLAEGLYQYDALFGRIPAGMVNIAARGVAASPDGLEQDGDGRGDRAAIDGDLATYWDEQDGGKLYRYRVAFNEPQTITGVGLVGWANHQFAPKDFEVWCDDRLVKQVANARYQDNFLLLPLPETACQALELKITGAYGGSPGIRELGIFSPKEAAAKSAARADAQGITAELVNGAEYVVRFKGQPLCAYAFAANQWKPYVRELFTTRGDNVLRDSPFDHKHHHALMYGIKVNGVNFWEEVPGCGIQKAIRSPAPECGKDAQGRPQAVLRQTLHWLASPDAALADTTPAALLVEDRTLILTVDEPAGEVALQWKSSFAVGAKTNQVTLTGANYHGIGARFLQSLDPLAAHFNADGKPDLSGTKQDVSKHPWAAVAFDQPNQPFTFVLAGHPQNARGDSWFFSMRQAFAYLSATQNLDQEPLVYRRDGRPFELRYQVSLYPKLMTASQVQERYKKWLEAGQ